MLNTVKTSKKFSRITFLDLENKVVVEKRMIGREKSHFLHYIHLYHFMYLVKSGPQYFYFSLIQKKMTALYTCSWCCTFLRVPNEQKQNWFRFTTPSTWQLPVPLPPPPPPSKNHYHCQNREEKSQQNRDMHLEWPLPQPASTIHITYQ